MSGDQESLTQSRLKDFISELNNFITSVGLGNVTYNAEIDKAMSMTESQLRSMCGEDCAVYGYKLQQFALYIQKEQNRHKNVARWAKHYMDIVVSKDMANYSDYASYETKVNAIKEANSFAKALNKIYITSISHADELDFVATRINGMAQTLKDLQYAKRFQNG
jgi:hypothetical protein